MTIRELQDRIGRVQSQLDCLNELLLEYAQQEAKKFAERQSTGIVLDHEKGFKPRHLIG